MFAHKEFPRKTETKEKVLQIKHNIYIESHIAYSLTYFEFAVDSIRFFSFETAGKAIKERYVD